MKIGGMGEQALRIYPNELRRLHEIPEEVDILKILPEIPVAPATVHVDRAGQPGYGASVREYRWYDELPREWVPHPHQKITSTRCLYIHIQHRYCFRGPEQGQVLTIENLDAFLKRFDELRRQEEACRDEKMADHFPEGCFGSWVDNDA